VSSWRSLASNLRGLAQLLLHVHPLPPFAMQLMRRDRASLWLGCCRQYSTSATTVRYRSIFASSLLSHTLFGCVVSAWLIYVYNAETRSSLCQCHVVALIVQTSECWSVVVPPCGRLQAVSFNQPAGVHQGYGQLYQSSHSSCQSDAEVSSRNI
jgi:hypothetical protein